MAAGPIGLRHGDSLKQDIGIGSALVQPLFVQGSRRISAGPPRLLGHLLGEDYPLLHDSQRYANRFVDGALLLAGKRFGGVGVTDLASESQWRSLFEL